MLKLAIIADDLTGALDSAVAFSGGGKVVVATHVGVLEKALQEQADVVAVSTRSREIGAISARDRVAQVLRAVPPGTRIFKKIDSRLKGNVAAELEPLPDRPMLVAPAIPEFGRIVRNGHLSGFGVGTPIKIAPLLGRFADRATVPDVTSPSQMRAALRAMPADATLVGARGLAFALSLEMNMGLAQVATLPHPICFAVGSTDPITLAQVTRLRRDCPDLMLVEAPAGAVPPRRGAPPTLVQMTEGAQTPPDVAAARFARGATALSGHAKTLLMTGGATAEAMLDALRLDVLSVTGEALPGLPVCRSGARCLITKSGGFGDDDTLVRLLAMATQPMEAQDHV